MFLTSLELTMIPTWWNHEITFYSCTILFLISLWMIRKYQSSQNRYRTEAKELRDLIARREMEWNFIDINNHSDTKEGIIEGDAFLRKFSVIVEDHIQDPDLDVSMLTRSLNMSRTQLHNRLKRLTGKPTTAVIRGIRLKKAKYLLEEGEMNVNEVANAVGFRSVSYFSTCFKKKFEINPRDI